MRGEVLRRAVARKSVSLTDVVSDKHPVADVFAELVGEGFLKKEGQAYRLR